MSTVWKHYVHWACLKIPKFRFWITALLKKKRVVNITLGKSPCMLYIYIYISNLVYIIIYNVMVATCTKYNNNHIYLRGRRGRCIIIICVEYTSPRSGGSEIILYFYDYRFRSFRLIFFAVAALWARRRRCREAQYTLNSIYI